MNYYVILNWGDIEPETIGPFPDEESRDKYAQRRRFLEGDQHSIFALDVGDNSVPKISTYSGEFMDSTAECLVNAIVFAKSAVSGLYSGTITKAHISDDGELVTVQEPGGYEMKHDVSDIALPLPIIIETGEDRYLAAAGEKCPNCGVRNATDDAPVETRSKLDASADGDTAHQEEACNKCGYTWLALWKLIGIDNLESPEDRRKSDGEPSI